MKGISHIYFLWISLFLIPGCQSSQNKVTNIHLVAESHVVNPDQNGVDSGLVSLIKPYKNILDDSMGTQIGSTEQTISKGFPVNPLGNLVTDMMIRHCRMNYSDQADFALTNNGGFRTPLNAGEITVGDVYELMPFENEMVILAMHPEDMSNLFKFILEAENTAVSSDIKIEYRGDSLYKAFIGNSLYSPDSTYYLLTTDYLANGGDDMKFLKHVQGRIKQGIRLRDIILLEIMQAGNQLGLSVSEEQRIIIHE